MKKIPTLFVRDSADRSRVTAEVSPGCLWVFREEGIATQKLDGACCMVRGGILYRRHQVKPGKDEPDGFECLETDPSTGKSVGWVRVSSDDPGGRWFLEGYENLAASIGWDAIPDDTYELIGPKVQGNPQDISEHMLVRHGSARLADVPVMQDQLRQWLADHLCEGVVWHHPDGRRAKIKRRDFGIPWPVRT